MADPGRRLGPNAVAILVLICLAAGLLLWQRPWESSDDAVVGIPDDAPARLAAQFRALTDADSESAFVAAAGTSRTAKVFARQAWRARTALGADAVELRYVSGGDVADHADGSATAVVDVSWRAGDEIGLSDKTVHTSSVAFRVAPQTDGRLSVVSAAPRDGALPIWLAGDVTVERVSGSVVIRVDGGDADLPVESMATAARSAVGRVVPGTKGDVTVVSPHTEAQMARLVGQPIDQVRQIAAVTTRLDGRGGSSDDTVIVLNPAVFSTMDRRAAQVVLTHEATHLLTHAVGTRAESWVVEGFADFVALHDDTAPLSVSAGQILADVKAGRGPKHLPTSADFNAESHGLGAVYESAWMIFRMLGQTYGDDRVVRFYNAVMSGTALDKALVASFGLTVDELTTSWRDYLAKSASTVS
ncbi:hypothetical protein ASE12_00785 [Aeromicrobium sp. Root236]|uniref:basic secretory protein-like protein n=1 Tax=Aeromicrobium sp. Root236 TaxID=1736498 RepID=UPI0006FA05A4|nr:basic secretory protein-like protein [Aeromicrobium sp. Root236]KRC63419.1 hypothetical protein ASE12_00785 [Aeromicrobium sp. Root236]